MRGDAAACPRARSRRPSSARRRAASYRTDRAVLAHGVRPWLHGRLRLRRIVVFDSQRARPIRINCATSCPRRSTAATSASLRPSRWHRARSTRAPAQPGQSLHTRPQSGGARCLAGVRTGARGAMSHRPLLILARGAIKRRLMLALDLRRSSRQRFGQGAWRTRLRITRPASAAGGSLIVAVASSAASFLDATAADKSRSAIVSPASTRARADTEASSWALRSALSAIRPSDGGSADVTASSFPSRHDLAGRRVLGVLELDAHGGELVADAVGLLEVLGLAGGDRGRRSAPRTLSSSTSSAQVADGKSSSRRASTAEAQEPQPKPSGTLPRACAACCLRAQAHEARRSRCGVLRSSCSASSTSAHSGRRRRRHLRSARTSGRACGAASSVHLSSRSAGDSACESMARRSTASPGRAARLSSSWMVTKLPSDLRHLLAFDLQEAVVHP